MKTKNSIFTIGGWRSFDLTFQENKIINKLNKIEVEMEKKSIEKITATGNISIVKRNYV